MAAPSKTVVTGAAQGLGRAVALRLAAPGLHVAVWDTQAGGAEETARLCRERGAVSRAWTVDVGAEFDAVYTRAVAVGADIAAPPVEQPWGMREFVLRLPDGHQLVVTGPA